MQYKMQQRERFVGTVVNRDTIGRIVWEREECFAMDAVLQILTSQTAVFVQTKN